MNSRYGTVPTGLGPISSKRADGHDRNCSSRRVVTSRKMSSTSGPLWVRSATTHPSLRAPTSLWTCAGVDTGSGAVVTEQRSFGSHHVGQHVAHRPSRALRRQLPLGGVEDVSELSDGGPCLVENIDHRFARSGSHALPFP